METKACRECGEGIEYEEPEPEVGVVFGTWYWPNCFASEWVYCDDPDLLRQPYR